MIKASSSSGARSGSHTRRGRGWRTSHAQNKSVKVIVSVKSVGRVMMKQQQQQQQRQQCQRQRRAPQICIETKPTLMGISSTLTCSAMSRESGGTEDDADDIVGSFLPAEDSEAIKNMKETIRRLNRYIWEVKVYTRCAHPSLSFLVFSLLMLQLQRCLP